MNETATQTVPALPTDEELIEKEAQNWANQAIAIHRRNALQETVQKRFRELMVAAGIPEKSEAEQVELLAQNEFEGMRAARHKQLAHARAAEMFRAKHPELFDQAVPASA